MGEGGAVALSLVVAEATMVGWGQLFGFQVRVLEGVLMRQEVLIGEEEGGHVVIFIERFVVVLVVVISVVGVEARIFFVHWEHCLLFQRFIIV